MERYVGILLNDLAYKKLLNTPQDNYSVPHFEEAGAHYGVVPAYLRLKNLKEAKSKTEALIRENQQFKACKIPVPQIIYNQASFQHPSSIEFLNRWAIPGRTIFNSCDHYSLHDIHYLLSLDPSLCQNLPPLWPVSSRTLENLKQEHSFLELVPEQHLAINEELHLICADGKEWELCAANQPAKSVLHEDLMLTLQIMNYYVRPVLPLLKKNQRPFVVNVCIQKDETDSWKITGMSELPDWRGADEKGEAPTLSIQQLKKEELYSDICILSKRISELLHASIPSIAEIGLEFGVTAQGSPLFLRWFPNISQIFRQLGLQADASDICQTPIGYASYLLNKSLQMFTEQQQALSP